MTQFQENVQTDGRTEGRKGEQILFYRTLPATSGYPIKKTAE